MNLFACEAPRMSAGASSAVPAVEALGRAGAEVKLLAGLVI